MQSVIENWKAKPELHEELRKALDKVVFEERGKGRLLSFYPVWMKNSEQFRIPCDGDNADGDRKLEGNSTYPVEDVSLERNDSDFRRHSLSMTETPGQMNLSNEPMSI